MENIQTLVSNNEHEKILLIQDPVFNSYKAIAAIHLGKFEEALSFLTTLCYEKAYCYYKLKKFYRSLKILRKLKGKREDILTAQNLYFLGYYSDAYNLLSKYGNEDEMAVDLSAMESLDSVNKANKQKPSLFTSKDTKYIGKKQTYKFKDNECAFESQYNLTFKNVNNEKMFIQSLSELDNKKNLENSCVQKQLKNLLDEDIVDLRGREQEIFQFNRGIITNIDLPVLFQNNFMRGFVTDYNLFKDYQTNRSEYLIGKRNVNIFSDKSKLLKCVILLKRKRTDARIEQVKKLLSTVNESLEKEIIETIVNSNDETLNKIGCKLLKKATKE